MIGRKFLSQEALRVRKIDADLLAGFLFNCSSGCCAEYLLGSSVFLLVHDGNAYFSIAFSNSGERFHFRSAGCVAR